MARVPCRRQQRHLPSLKQQGPQPSSAEGGKNSSLLVAIKAPYKADAQLAYLCEHRCITHVISDDCDIFAYGCPRVISKLDFGIWKADVTDLAEHYKNLRGPLHDVMKGVYPGGFSTDFLKQLRLLSPEEKNEHVQGCMCTVLRDLHIMTGCDYGGKLSNVGGRNYCAG